MKLLNFKCPKCGREIEKLEKKGWKMEVFCPDCNVRMRPFNFKNNRQRMFWRDIETK